MINTENMENLIKRDFTVRSDISEACKQQF